MRGASLALIDRIQSIVLDVLLQQLGQSICNGDRSLAAFSVFQSCPLVGSVDELDIPVMEVHLREIDGDRCTDPSPRFPE